jgi:hypothetical protein
VHDILKRNFCSYNVTLYNAHIRRVLYSMYPRDIHPSFQFCCTYLQKLRMEGGGGQGMVRGRRGIERGRSGIGGKEGLEGKDGWREEEQG